MFLSNILSNVHNSSLNLNYSCLHSDYCQLTGFICDSDINIFTFVAFFGVDPAVNESGKLKGDRVKMSKRGTRLGRRALYAAALASILTKRNGEAFVDFN